MKVVFMGTPDFAVPCLQKLIDNKYDIAAVFTQPDKKTGRKQLLTPPPVKVLAHRNYHKYQSRYCYRCGIRQNSSALGAFNSEIRLHKCACVAFAEIQRRRADSMGRFKR